MNDATKAQIIQKIGANNTVELKKHMDRILSDGKSEPLAQNPVTRLAQYTVVTTLAGKLASIPKQLTSATHYLGAGLNDGVSTTAVLKQAGKLPFAYVKGLSGRNANANSPVTLTQNEAEVISAIFKDAFVRNRVSGKDIDTETRTLANDLTSSSLRNVRRKLTQAAMSPTILGDIGGVLSGGIPFTLATYHNNINNKGMSHEEAMQDAIYKFVQVSNQTQQSQRDDIISNAQRDPLYRIFLTYTTSQVAAMSELTKAAKILSDRKGGYTTKEYLNAGRKFGYYMMANSVFQIVASGALGMYLMDDDDDEREAELKKTALYNTLMDTFSSNLQGFGLPGKAVDWLMNQLRGRDMFNNIPVIDRLYSGTEIASNYTSTLIDAAQLYAEGKITASEMFGTLYWDVEKKTHDKLAKFTGAKNIIDTVKAWGQYYGSDEDSEMTWWDSFMNRQLDDEGRIYKTGEERGDDLYMQLFGPERPAVEKFPEGVQKEAEKRNQFGTGGFRAEGDIFAEGGEERAPGGLDWSSAQKEVEIKKRDKDEMLLRIREVRQQDKLEEELDNYIESVVKEGEGAGKEPDIFKTDSLGKVEFEEAEKKEINERVNRWRENYKDKFGEYPPEDMTLDEIMDAL